MTPLMLQYWDIKSAHEDKVLLFRMGDFFEMFHRDAEIAAPILNITLTSRNKKAENDTPMCGVPHHSIAGPINKLLSAGYKVAICDQIEDPKFAKGIVKRAVTRILSPGVVYDPETLDSAKTNYLASFDQSSLSFLDLTTGEAFYYILEKPEQRERLLDVLQPVEIVLSPGTAYPEASASQGNGPIVTFFSLKDEKLETTTLPPTALRLKAYAKYMQGENAEQIIPQFEERELLQRLDLSATVIRHLEVFENYRGDAQGSLFFAINRCKTSSGTRLLKRWLQFPLAAPISINSRLDAVEFWVKNPGLLKDVRRVLGGMGDIERRLGKIGNPGCNPRDLESLAHALAAGLEATSIAKHLSWPASDLKRTSTLIEQIRRTLIDEPPVQTKNGHFIRVGVDPTLDELIELSTNSHQKIMELEVREKEATGISSLKVRYNNVFGYYIEITNTHKDKAPAHYQRKQTLANAERFLTKELEELEHKVLTAQGKRLELELQIFESLKATSLGATGVLMNLARLWSELDVITSLAWLALEQNYVRPLIESGRGLTLKKSRHPVVEQAMKQAPFVANDIVIDQNHAMLLTGPNMAGKSTLMRQVAIAVMMAQTGSFVPAQEAVLPIFDRIFTRIGASDFLSEGLSTFMVEMTETAEMLQAATPNSLVILDEVGRGTSTFDGMSLAQAILEYLLENSRAMTLFATHYHELTAMQARYSQLTNAHMSIHEKNGQISFLHSLVKGPANKSYGIQVARLAGLPTDVTKRAALILKDLESRAQMASPQMSLLDVGLGTEPVFASENVADPLTLVEKNALEMLRDLKIDGLTPIQSLVKLSELQNFLGSKA